MLSLSPPDSEQIVALIDELREAPFSYREVAATRASAEAPEVLPGGYDIDRTQVVLGRGAAVWDAAKAALADWAPFHLPWIRVEAEGVPAPGVLVAVMVKILGVWWTNLSRVVYTVDEPHRFGFAYGTLAHHAETGEERFLVERARETGEVTYRILAFSRPRHPLARLGYPLVRATQRRFGVGSRAALLAATRLAATPSC